MNQFEAAQMMRNKVRINDYMMAEIESHEDDVGDMDDDDNEVVSYGLGARSATNTSSKIAKSYTKTAKPIIKNTLSTVGKTAYAANFVQTGNILTAATSGASAALAPIAAITGPVGIALMLVDIAASGYSAQKTYHHITKLEGIMMRIETELTSERRLHDRLQLGSGQAISERLIQTQVKIAKLEATQQAIGFCIKKKNKKLKRKGFGCIPAIGSLCNSVYTVGRTIQKRHNNTRGVERRQQAFTLWDNTLQPNACPFAIEACKDLLGIKIYTMIEGMTDGHLVLKKKLKST